MKKKLSILSVNYNRGFTLVEMLVTMTLVIVVLIVTAGAFESILKTTAKVTSSEESNIEGVIGLEMFRHDLQQTGFGIPGAFLSPAPEYAEATVAPANKLNDAPSGIPRPVASWDALVGASNSLGSVTYSVLDNSDYLAIKASTVGTNQHAQKWTYLTYSAGGKAAKRWASVSDNLTEDESRVIIINRSFTSSGQILNTLTYNDTDQNTANSYWVTFPTNKFPNGFYPTAPDQTFYVYGIGSTSLGMPFNRVDYFVARPSDTARIPTTCADNTGILYKATINHSDGKLNYMPLLDCVADMQIVFGWDTKANGIITESSAYSDDVSKIFVSGVATKAEIKTIMEDANEIRSKLKYVKVFVMAQEGRKDTGYNNTSKIVVGDIESITNGHDLTALRSKGWLNYRWKIYRIFIKPKNLSSS